MAYEFTLTATLSASPREVFDAWLSSEGHTAMTGGVAHIDPTVGGSFDAWDAYITGKTLALDPGRRIRQTWRTLNFTPNDPDSTIEVVLEPVGDSTLLTLIHSNVPDGQTRYEEGGWQQFYFEPMKRRFEWLRMRATM
ncbi:MAG: SRPBCC domain-containing protein [Deltaproteobacteria bacterium]|nr:SRPBCC domain-containing protein [Deltaproteobacteria bacterium]